MMKNALLRMAAVALVVGCVTCKCDKRLVLATYNTGLAPTVPGYDARSPNVIRFLTDKARRFYDFVCLQEVWFESDIKKIIDEMGDTLPHHYSAIHQAPDTLRGPDSDLAPCTHEEVGAVFGCVFKYCASKPPATLKVCIVTNCPDQIYGVNQRCRTCMSVAASDTEVTDKCLDGRNRFNEPGLLVFSKHPMTDVKFVDYHDGRAVQIQRGYIQAQVQNLTLVCTHFTSVFPYFFDVNITDLYSNYTQMQRAEINKMWSEFSSTDHVLMGDLNTGPLRNNSGQPYIKGEAKENYEYLTCDLKYYNPYIRTAGECTYCNSDNDATWEDHKEDAIVDHVLLSKDLHPASAESKRVFTRRRGQLSDHYGVKLRMCLS